ncbi:MAG: ThiF family adenylyltransferase [Candidatus Poseidoniales archaeon]|nr:ThiF family adenylyltransferase [Candidatus Poseidoniales archaeon]
MMASVLIIGVGGIGGLLTDIVSRAVAFSDLTKQNGMISLTLMDGDIVEERNLPHQRFAAADVGKPKVEALVRQLQDVGITEERGVFLIPVGENFSADTNLSEYDLVVVAVDREEPRRLVHENAGAWLDLRCRGDGFLMWSHLDDVRVLNMFPTLPDGESASCQLEEAVETGNIQFGFAEAASHGAQWVIQWLRGAQVPQGRTYTIHMGDLPLPEVAEEEQE